MALFINQSQAERVISLFDGVEFEGRKFRSGFSALAYAIKWIGGPYNRSNIYRWTWPKERGGTGGVIPTWAIPWVEKAARACGVLLPPGIMDPRGQSVRVIQKRQPKVAG